MLTALDIRGQQKPEVQPGFQLEPGEVESRRRWDRKEGLGPF